MAPRRSNETSRGRIDRAIGHDSKKGVLASTGVPLIPLTHERDSAARIAWRNRLPHQDAFVFPEDFLALVSGPHSDPVTLLSHLDRIGRQTKTQIVFSHTSNTELLLWGDELETKAAKDALARWISATIGSVTRLKASKAMPSVPAQTQKTYRRFEWQLQELARQQAFKRDPDERAIFGVTGIYLWPLETAQPQDMLGTGFEALDPIRMFHLCHIVHDQHANAFKIFANSDEQVRGAIESIENAVLEFKVSNCAPLTTRIIHPPSDVSAKRYIGTKGNWLENDQEQDSILRLHGEVLTTQERSLWERSRQKVMRQNQLKMQSAMVQALSRIRVYRGKIHMRLQFGVFAIHKLGWNVSETAQLPLQEFFSNLDCYAPEGNLHQVFATVESAREVLTRLCADTKLLSPYLAQTQRLEDTTPSLKARFTFESDGPRQVIYETGDIFLDDYSHGDRIPKGHWSSVSRSLPLQMYSIGLDGGITWKMQISVDSSPNDPLNPVLKTFEKGIDIASTSSLQDSAATAKPIFKYLYSPLLESFTQKTSFRFRVKRNPSYILEFSIYDSFKAHDRKYSNTRWAVTVHHQGWDEILIKNSALRRGAKATWKPDLEQFFPCTRNAATRHQHAGFTEVMEIAQSIAELLNGIKGAQ